MKTLTYDFETYYADDYSLTKQTTEEYIRDPRFEVVGVAVAVGDAPAQFFTGDATQTHLWLSQFDWDNSLAIAHNAAFDAAILSWRFGIKPRMHADTLSMARALYGQSRSCSLAALADFFGLPAKGVEVHNAKGRRREGFTAPEMQAYGDYCRHDTHLCRDMFLRMMPRFPHSELKLIDWTIRAFTEPKFVLDKDALAHALVQFRLDRAGALAAAGVNDMGVLRSDQQFAELLMNLGVEPPTKISPTTGKPAWAFSRSDIEFMDLREHSDSRVSTLVEARLGSKSSIMETRYERLLGIAERGSLPVPLQYYGAGTTGRWSGFDNINLQNVPKSGAIRKAMKAPPGHYVAAGDLSQIELRVNAWQSRQTDALDVLARGEDIYCQMATGIYGFTVTKKTHPLERFVGKTAVLGCGYGCGGAKFQHMIKVAARRDGFVLPDDSVEFAADTVAKYRRTYAKIAAFWKQAEQAIPVIAAGGGCMIGPYEVREGTVLLPNGMRLVYPDLRRVTGEDGRAEWVYDRRRGRVFETTKLYGAKLVENITQAVARLFMGDAILRFAQSASGKLGARVVATVHDELVVIAPDHIPPDSLAADIRWAMTAPPAWAPDIPLACTVGVGPSYGECEK